MLNESKTFNGMHRGTVSYPDVDNPVYDIECPKCDGVGHIHCKECKEEVRCPQCGGTGKKNVYGGNIYKIYWDVPNHTNSDSSTAGREFIY